MKGFSGFMEDKRIIEIPATIITPEKLRELFDAAATLDCRWHTKTIKNRSTNIYNAIHTHATRPDTIVKISLEVNSRRDSSEEHFKYTPEETLIILQTIHPSGWICDPNVTFKIQEKPVVKNSNIIATIPTAQPQKDYGFTMDMKYSDMEHNIKFLLQQIKIYQTQLNTYPDVIRSLYATNN